MRSRPVRPGRHTHTHKSNWTEEGFKIKCSSSGSSDRLKGTDIEWAKKQTDSPHNWRRLSWTKLKRTEMNSSSSTSNVQFAHSTTRVGGEKKKGVEQKKLNKKGVKAVAVLYEVTSSISADHWSLILSAKSQATHCFFGVTWPSAAALFFLLNQLFFFHCYWWFPQKTGAHI